MRSFRFRKKGIIVAEKPGLPSMIPGARIISPGSSESHHIQTAHVRTYEDHRTMVNPEKTRINMPVRMPERTISIPMPSVKLPPIIPGKKWKTMKLEDILDDEQRNILLYLVNAQDWDEIWDYLESLKEPLDAKGIVPGYLYYVLQAQLKENVPYEELMGRIDTATQEWDVGMKLKSVELNMISRMEDINKLIIENPSQKDFLEKQLRDGEHELANLRKYKQIYLSMDADEKAELESMDKQTPPGYVAIKAGSFVDALSKVQRMAQLQDNLQALENKIAEDIASLPKEFQPIGKMINNEMVHGDTKKVKTMLDEIRKQLEREEAGHSLPAGQGNKRKKI